jgi:prolyl 4-hydroxylase
MNTFKPDWEKWIDHNISLGNCKRIMFEKSLEAGYSYNLLKNKLKIEYDIQDRKVNSTVSLRNASRINATNLDIRVIDNFLNAKECSEIIKIINSSNLTNSSIYNTDNPNEMKINNKVRTSETCLFDKNSKLINDIESRICRSIGINNRFSEKIQGQKYSIHQEFTLHSDYFDPELLKQNKSIHGQRTWTFMIYLNDVEEGGYTSFPNAFISVKPIIGRAVIWNNLNEKNMINEFSKHQGMPVLKGKKYILTKWFKETEINLEIKNEITDHDFLPIFHKIGFEKIRIQMDCIDKIKEWMNIHENEFVKENNNSNIEKNMKSRHLCIQNIPNTLLSELEDNFKRILTKWINYSAVLIHTATYGIREYKRGSKLENHCDKINTHVISAIIHLGDKSDKPWELYIEDHNFRPHKIIMEYFDVVLYESTTCLHGRPTPFEGDFHRNMYIHFKPENW